MYEHINVYIYIYMGGCQNYGPFLDPYYSTAPNIQGTPKGIVIYIYIYMERERERSKTLGVGVVVSFWGSIPPAIEKGI